MKNPDDRSGYHTKMQPEGFADHFGMSRAFVHLALTNGCPSSEGAISEASFFGWMEENYEKIRFLAGLRPFPAISKEDRVSRVSEKRKRALLTTVEFTATRACGRETRDGARAAYREILKNW